MTLADPLPSGRELVAALEVALRGDGRPAPNGITALACELLASNARQWDLEDVAHDPAITDQALAAVKRAIDRLNLARHDLLERIDAAVDAVLVQSPSARPATDTPAMVVDRLSVLLIRIARTAAAASADGATTDYAGRLPLLEARLAVLTDAFDAYVDDLRSGRRRFVRHEELKLYAAERAAGPATSTSAGDSRPG